MSAAQVIESTLESNGLEYRNKGEGRYFVTLPGNKKLQTNCWLILTEHALLLEALARGGGRRNLDPDLQLLLLVWFGRFDGDGFVSFAQVT